MPTPLTAAEFFAAKLAFETDPSDLAADRASSTPPVVLDVRSTQSWGQGRIPGALHVPNAELAERAGDVVPDLTTPVVVYCWGPGCNGSTRAARRWATPTSRSSSAASSTGPEKVCLSSRTRGGRAEHRTR